MPAATSIKIRSADDDSSHVCFGFLSSQADFLREARETSQPKASLFQHVSFSSNSLSSIGYVTVATLSAQVAGFFGWLNSDFLNIFSSQLSCIKSFELRCCRGRTAIVNQILAKKVPWIIKTTEKSRFLDIIMKIAAKYADKM